MAKSQNTSCPSFILYRDDKPVGRGVLTSCFFGGKQTPSFLTLQSLICQDSVSTYTAQSQEGDQKTNFIICIDKVILKTCASQKIAHFKVIPKTLGDYFKKVRKLSLENLLQRALKEGNLQFGSSVRIFLSRNVIVEGKVMDKKQPTVHIEGDISSSFENGSAEKGAAVVNESGELVAILEEMSENGRYKIIPISDYSSDFDEERLNVCRNNEAEDFAEKRPSNDFSLEEKAPLKPDEGQTNDFLPKQEEARLPLHEGLQGSGNPEGLYQLAQIRLSSLGDPPKLQQGPQQNLEDLPKTDQGGTPKQEQQESLEGPYPPDQRQYHSLGGPYPPGQHQCHSLGDPPMFQPEQQECSEDLPNQGDEQDDQVQMQPKSDQHRDVAGIPEVKRDLAVHEQEEEGPEEACGGRNEPEKEKMSVLAGYKIGSMDVNVIHSIAMSLDCEDRWENVAVKLGFQNKIDELHSCYAGGGKPAVAFLHQLVNREPNELLSSLKQNISSIDRVDISNFIDSLGVKSSIRIIELRDNYHEKFLELARKLEKGKNVKRKYWINLAPLYGFNDVIISGIQSTIRSNQQFSPTEKIIRLLKQQRPWYTVEEFVEALSSCGYVDAVESVQNYFQEKDKLKRGKSTEG